MVTARFLTRLLVLLTSIFLLSACGGKDSTTSTPLTSEGTITDPFPDPLPVNTETPHSGQVGNKAAGKSYYTTATVTPNTTYTITLYGLSADVDLEVYNDRPFDYILGPECASRNGSTTVEYCTVTTNSTTTSMNIVVDGQYTLDGATFSISVNGSRTAGPCDYPADTDVKCFDFEPPADLTDFTLSGPTGAEWSIDGTNDATGTGTSSIHSGLLGISETSCFSYTPTVATSYVSFNLEADSEKYFGLLLFYIDDVLQPPVWSGILSWHRVTFNTVSGTHTYKWCHSQNSATPTSDDVWVDDINIK